MAHSGTRNMIAARLHSLFHAHAFLDGPLLPDEQYHGFRFPRLRSQTILWARYSLQLPRNALINTYVRRMDTFHGLGPCYRRGQDLRRCGVRSGSIIVCD